MEDEAAAKRRRLEHHRCAPGLSSFHMEDLPEEIQPLVMSLLSLKEAARTSIVSRNWRMLWTHHPNLCFDGTKNRPNDDEDYVKVERAKFIETVNSIVQQHSGIGLNKFSISISAVKVLNMCADMDAHHPVWLPQGHTVARSPACMFTNLRHLTCEITIFTKDPNRHSELLQLAHYLAFAPQLETLQLHMFYDCDACHRRRCWEGEVTGGGLSCMHRHLSNLKTVYMSGFRCYRAQVELLCGILEMAGPALEIVTLEPKVTLHCARVFNMLICFSDIRRWARVASERFGKAINVVREASRWQLPS
ncbi:unnamed protein product [Urochloa humidicola]